MALSAQWTKVALIIFLNRPHNNEMVYVNRQLEVKDFVQILAHHSLGHIILSMTPSLILFLIRKMKKNKTYFICCFEDYMLLV